MLGEAFTVISSDPWLTVPTAAIIAVMTLCLAHLGDTLRGRLAERTSADAPTRAPAPAQDSPKVPPQSGSSVKVLPRSWSATSACARPRAAASRW